MQNKIRFLFSFSNASIFGNAKDTIKWAENQKNFEFSRTDGTASAIKLVCLAES